MQRRGAKLIFATTLALLTATTSLWVWSYFRFARAVFLRSPYSLYAEQGQGAVGIAFDDFSSSNLSRGSLGLMTFVRPPGNLGPYCPAFPGIGFSHGNVGSGIVRMRTAVSLRLYWPALLFALAATAQYLRLRRPLPPTLCPACRYDCRATPARCPECGTNLPQLAKR